MPDSVRPPTWSLITVTYNSEKELLRFWSTTPLPKNVEWVVVDNNSSDSSAALAGRLGAKVIPLPQNRGFGAANNIGFARSTGQYIAFVNPDVAVEYSTLDKLASAATQTGGLVTPQLMYPDGTSQPNGRGYPFLADKILNRLRAKRATEYLQFASPEQHLAVVWAIGAVVAAERGIFKNLGPWDERFFLYYEDSDLGLRAAAKSIPTIVCGDITWVHGWARETTTLSISAWKRELPSLIKFYSRYPRLLSPTPRRTSRRLYTTGWPTR